MLFLRKSGRVGYLQITGFVPRTRGIMEMLLKKMTFNDILFSLNFARKLDGIFIEISESDLTLSEIWELRREILRLREEGKKVVALLNGGGIGELFLADACSRVFVSPFAKFMLLGFAQVINFFGDFFRKLDIEIHTFRSGELKAIPDILTKNKIPPALRRELECLIDDIKKILVDEIKRFPKDFLFSGIRFARDVLDFVDGEDDNISRIVSREFRGKSIVRLSRRFLPFGIPRVKKVAVLNMNGIVAEGGQNTISPSFFSRILLSLAERSDIEGVVIRINSRGGDAVGSEILREKVEILSKQKPVVVATSSVCASGGYLIATGAQKIFSTPFSLVGSIGVFIVRPYIGKLLRRFGINTFVVKKGEFADMLIPFTRVTEGERKILKELVKREHDEFKKQVKEKRKNVDIDKVSTGAVFTGRKAKELGLVDGIGSLIDVIDTLKSVTGARTVEELPRFSLYDLFSQSIPFSATRNIAFLALWPFDFERMTQ